MKTISITEKTLSTVAAALALRKHAVRQNLRDVREVWSTEGEQREWTARFLGEIEEIEAAQADLVRAAQ